MSGSKGTKVKSGKTCLACSYRDEDGYCTYIQDSQSYLWVSAETTCRNWTSNEEVMRQREAQQRAMKEEHERQEREERERREREEQERREREEREERERREREERERFLREREKLQEIEGMLEKLSSTILEVIDEILEKECIPPAFETPPEKSSLISIVVEYLRADGKPIMDAISNPVNDSVAPPVNPAPINQANNSTE